MQDLEERADVLGTGSFSCTLTDHIQADLHWFTQQVNSLFAKIKCQKHLQCSNFRLAFKM